MSISLRGTGVALVTPFDQSGNIDLVGLKKLVEHVVSNNVEYLVVMGTTGESVTLSQAEKKLVLAQVLEFNNKRVPVILGIGGNNTAEIIESIQAQDFNGISAVLSVSPYYNKPTQEGIYQHFKSIATASTVPIILYNVPGRTASNILPETAIRLANDFSNIIAIKEASGNVEQVMKIMNLKPEHFSVLSGDDALTLPLISIGAIGVISVVGNAYPGQFSELVRLALKGNYQEARKIHYSLLEFIDYLFTEGNPGGIKCALQLMNICGDALRLPLVNVSNPLKESLKYYIEKMKVKQA